MLGTGCLRSAREALSLRCSNHWCTWKASLAVACCLGGLCLHTSHLLPRGFPCLFDAGADVGLPDLTPRTVPVLQLEGRSRPGAAVGYPDKLLLVVAGGVGSIGL